MKWQHFFLSFSVSVPLRLKILSIFIFGPFSLDVIYFNPRFHFIQILVSIFERVERNSLDYSEGERKFSDIPKKKS